VRMASVSLVVILLLRCFRLPMGSDTD
jgi:hypothetical protein